MGLILGIETSCDETGVSLFDPVKKIVLSSTLFSQIKFHEKYGGVVPEIASRSQLEKISILTQEALLKANVSLGDIEIIGVTYTPGLAGSLLVGVCFAKGLSWANNKKLIGINHLEGHIFSSFLTQEGEINRNILFPHLCLSVSGGHTAIYKVYDFGKYVLLASTIDDAAGEAFDKIAKVLGLGYPGGPEIEKQAQEVNFKDFFKYPRTKTYPEKIFFSFSGLKTAVLYSLVKLGAYNLSTGPVKEKITHELQAQVSSSLLVCIGDIFEKNIKTIFLKDKTIMGLTFTGGVACNKYLRARLANLCERNKKFFIPAPPQFCTDNGAMIAFVTSYKAAQNYYDDITLDVII